MKIKEIIPSPLNKKTKVSNQVEAVQITNRLGQKIDILRSPNGSCLASVLHIEYNPVQFEQLTVSAHPFGE